MARKSIEERFWPKVNKAGPIPAHRPELGPCWVWTASKVRASAHLFLGTNADNQADMKAKGRGTIGDRSWARRHPEMLARGMASTSAKLTEEQVREIRASSDGSMALAARYGVGYRQIWKIRTWKTWKHLQDEPQAVSA